LIAKLGKVSAQPFAEVETLFRDHYGLVYRTAYGVTGRAEDAEDVVQTIFLRLMRRHESPDLTRNPQGYFYRAAVNLSLNLIRQRRRTVTDDVASLSVPLHHSQQDSEEKLHRSLYEAIAELPAKAAEILILRYVHGRSDAEIAKLLGTSRGTIAVNLYRSRTRLKKLLRAYMGVKS
jgi:RNA polymerase sigma-70 factor (ECF subfamily)